MKNILDDRIFFFKLFYKDLAEDLRFSCLGHLLFLIKFLLQVSIFFEKGVTMIYNF